MGATPQDAPGAYLGVNTHSQQMPPDASPTGGPSRGGRGGAPDVVLVITSVSAGSPAENAGLKAGDQILEVEGAKATPKAINDLLTPAQAGGNRGGRGQAAPPVQPSVAVKKPGEKLKLRISRNGAAQDVDVELGKAVTRTYTFQAPANPTALQAAILKDWLRAVQ